MIIKKILINTTLEKFIKNVNFKIINSCSNDSLDNMLTQFTQKYKNIEHFIDTIVIKLVVDNENKAVEDFNSNNIIFYYEIENIILLNKILVSNSRYKNKLISVYFIIDNPSNKDYLQIEDYVIGLARYESNKHSNHITVENSLSKTPSYYVKNAKKSVINSLFNTNPRKVFRISDSKNLIDIDSINDTLKNKYLSLQCPICSKISNDAKRYEITEESVNEVITIERSTSKISFNCLHEYLEINQCKFFFTPEEFGVDMNKYNDITLQVWTLKNFKYIIERELNASN